MKLLTTNTDYNETITIAYNLQGVYDKPVIFHCYWNGSLNEKHLNSILSCYYFNVLNNKHKIILWVENNIPNYFNQEISKYCTIRQFSLKEEIKLSNFMPTQFYYKKALSFYSDVVRYLLLYNYGGCWFDLDCLFLRNFDPIFKNYESEVCVYEWEKQNYPNGAIYISLIPNSSKMKKNIEFILKRNRGWGFQEALLSYDLPLDILVLPCSWFDPSWIPNPYNIKIQDFLKSQVKEYNFDNFFNGAFCYHWHNQWDNKIEENSIMDQLMLIILSDIKKFCIYKKTNKY